MLSPSLLPLPFSKLQSSCSGPREGGGERGEGRHERKIPPAHSTRWYFTPCRACPRQMSPLWGSNPRPYAYEAHALPAELRRLTQLALSENHGILPDDPANMGCFELGTSNRLHFLLAWLAFTGRHGLARRTRGCCKLCPNIKPNTFRPSRFFWGGIVFFHCFFCSFWVRLM